MANIIVPSSEINLIIMANAIVSSSEINLIIMANAIVSSSEINLIKMANPIVPNGEINLIKMSNPIVPNDWQSYKEGFGTLEADGDFWLSNEAVHILTNLAINMVGVEDNVAGELVTATAAAAVESVYELRVDFKDRTQGDQFAQYKTFKIMDESNNYRLLLGQHVAGTTNEDSTSGLANHNNQDFTTVDRENEGTPFNCAETNQGGWWYSNCGLANFNSRLPPKYNIGIISYRSADQYYSPIFVEIKMRLL
ncbi:hypothetical protein RRG08_002040 [Elysia crispata]|uniref:Fibrinogen C-terminal domain-containing protein n=1 Tax=Elysia crispata TaxID=231223 RepID=A0AAE0ZML6_9GAST|nr:hypothetical protein RRG08_002040 [Elysia crispata]